MSDMARMLEELEGLLGDWETLGRERQRQAWAWDVLAEQPRQWVREVKFATGLRCAR